MYHYDFSSKCLSKCRFLTLLLAMTLDPVYISVILLVQAAKSLRCLNSESHTFRRCQKFGDNKPTGCGAWSCNIGGKTKVGYNCFYPENTFLNCKALKKDCENDAGRNFDCYNCHEDYCNSKPPEEYGLKCYTGNTRKLERCPEWGNNKPTGCGAWRCYIGGQRKVGYTCLYAGGQHSITCETLKEDCENDGGKYFKCKSCQGNGCNYKPPQ